MSGKTVVLKAYADRAPIYIKTLWNETSFEVCLLAGNVVWRADCLAADIRRYCIEYNETPEVYMSNAKRCLSTYSDNHLYELRLEDKQSDKSMVFVWKTKIPGGPSVKCGSLRLVPTDQKTDAFLDHLLETNRLLLQNFQETTSRNEALQTELNKALEDLKQVTELKSQMETDLYGKFIQCLNSKKRRIKVLEQHLENLNGGSDDI